MINRIFVFVFYYIVLTESRHFNGGTITWEPVNPYTNSSSVEIRIIQTYSWTYPTIKCLTNVPTSTSNTYSQPPNLLQCVADCSTDGDYSTKPISILTDCQSINDGLGLMTSQRILTTNLTAGAHFYVANIGSAWAPLNSPPKSGLQWSIVGYIDLRMRPDGFLNTPPVASVLSPQYAFVNQTIQIDIPISDANPSDDLRCRWAEYKPGYRRKRNQYQSHLNNNNNNKSNEKQILLSRKKRQSSKCSKCTSSCKKDCRCTCSMCAGTSCTGSKCTSKNGCTAGPTSPTTSETPGTTRSTSSFANRQAIDECGDTCFPSSVPNGTTLYNNCTLTFKGLKPDTWYAVSIQVNISITCVLLSNILSFFFSFSIG